MFLLISDVITSGEMVSSSWFVKKWTLCAFQPFCFNLDALFILDPFCLAIMLPQGRIWMYVVDVQNSFMLL